MDHQTKNTPRTSRSQCIANDRKLRENLDERQIDQMIEDTFPASDPPSTW